MRFTLTVTVGRVFAFVLFQEVSGSVSRGVTDRLFRAILRGREERTEYRACAERLIPRRSFSDSEPPRCDEPTRAEAQLPPLLS